MIEDHERIDELLAGYALLALSGDDADEVDRLLTDHVPGCARCRETLAGFQALSGDLALATSPAPLPETVLPRLHRSIEETPVAGRRLRRGALVALAASVVAVAAMGGLSLVLGGRLSEAETRAGTALEILSLMRSPGAEPVSLEPRGETPPSSGLVEVSGVQTLYLASDNCPPPSEGHAYQLWLGADGEWIPVGQMFAPDNGVVLLELEVDTSAYDGIWITEELIGPPPETPNTSGWAWSASL
ncbi:MAG TPA: anti-sigma factor [Actinomycetota bacterium]